MGYTLDLFHSQGRFFHLTQSRTQLIFTMSFELKEAVFADLGEIGAVLDKAHAEDSLISQLMPLVDRPGRAAFWAGWLRADFSKPGEKMFKIVEGNSGYIHLFNISNLLLVSYSYLLVIKPGPFVLTFLEKLSPS
jgi:hypothetical protein